MSKKEEEVIESKPEKFIFGKKYVKYNIESVKDTTDRLGTGSIGFAKRITKDTKMGIKKGSFISTVKSNTLFGEDGKPLIIKMVFANEAELVRYWTFKKGGSKFICYPIREEDNIAE